MMRLETVEQSLGIKALSVLLAVLIWACMAVERPDEVTLSVPVLLEQLPPGLAPAAAPNRLELRVKGPRILLWRLSLKHPVCRLDLSATGPGKVSFPIPEHTLGLDPELTVVRLYPTSLDLTLAAAPRR